jgi:hypothetical protein
MVSVLSYVSCVQLCQIDLCSGRRKKRVDTGVGSIEERCANGVREERACCAASTQSMPAPSAGAPSARIITSRASPRHSWSFRPCGGGAGDESQMTSSNRAPKFHRRGGHQTGLQNSIVGVVTRSGSIGSSRGHHGKPLRGPQWQSMTDRVSDTLYCNTSASRGPYNGFFPSRFPVY